MEKKTKKKVLIDSLICVSLLIIIWTGYIIASKKVEMANAVKGLQEDNFDFVFEVESAEVTSDKVILSGWVFIPNQNVMEDDIEIHLYDADSQKIIYFENVYCERSDVEQYFGGGYDCMVSGFSASAKAKKLDFENKTYEVVVSCTGDRDIYRTGTYVTDSEISYINPKEYKPLNVFGSVLEEVVDRGILRVYRPDVGIYVYQHEKKLYWIIDENYSFDNDNGNIEVSWAAIDEKGIGNNYVIKGITYQMNFEQNEIVELATEQYRVSSCDIPEEYPVLYITTGEWTEEMGWIWRSNFRISYADYFFHEDVK